MYGRRRVGSVVPASRRPTDSASLNDNCDSLFPCSTSFQMDVTASRSAVTTTITSVRTRSGRCLDAIESRTHQRSAINLRSRNSVINGDSVTLTNTSGSAASCSVIRQAVAVNSKSNTRTRRRASIRSPVYQLIVSPNQHDSSNLNGDYSDGNNSADNSVQIVRTEEVGWPRTTRSGRRVTSANSALRRLPPIASRNPPLSRHSQIVVGTRRSQNVIINSQVRAAIAAVQSDVSQIDDDCVICLCEKSNRSVVVPCMHTFCFDCIYRWMCINPSCPLCKRLAQRIIHSVLSDTEFTELHVSELPPPPSLSDHHSNLTATLFELDDRLYDSIDRNRTVSRSTFQSLQRRPFHHHPPNRNWDFANRHSSSMHAFGRSNGRDDVSLAADNRTDYRLSSELGSPVHSHRMLLINLADSALRPRNSVFLDNLLLRQLIYIFNLDSMVTPAGSELIRDTTPEHLTSNETHQHRLAAFIRRELRVLAPWLAYHTTSEMSQSNDHINEAVTSPLISGAPGFGSETPELDRITNLLVQHYCTVSMTDDQAVVELLTSQPAFVSSLVPRNYIYHFASEVVHFAQFSGTLEQYDWSVCLYRRQVTLGSLYTASTCHRPRLRRSRTDAQRERIARSELLGRDDLTTHPLIHWLLQRLFAHSVFGSTTANPTSGVGGEPLLTSDTNVTCQSHCSRLANSSRSLLEAVQSFMRFNDQINDRLANANRNDNVHHPTTETYPNWLLYQRVLSELIDQARFSEALCGHFDQSAVVDVLQPAIRPHSLALRRLEGLFFLFTLQMPEIRTVPEYLVIELLYMPLMPMTLTPCSTVIDLTDINRTDQSQAVSNTRLNHSATNNNINGLSTATSFTNINWHFLPDVSALPSQQQQQQPSVSDAETTAMVEDVCRVDTVRSQNGFRDSHHHRHSSPNWHLDTKHCVVISSDSSDQDDDNERHLVIRPSHLGELTSDESDDTNVEAAGGDRMTMDSCYLQSVAQNSDHSSYTKAIALSVVGAAGGEQGDSRRNSPSNTEHELDIVRHDAAKLSLDSIGVETAATSTFATLTNRHEEPMEIDDKVDEPVLSSDCVQRNSLFTSSKRRLKRRSKFERGLLDVFKRSCFGGSSRTKSSVQIIDVNTSPIHIETSDSDCELIHESIRVDSDYSRSPSSSDSSDCRPMIVLVNSPGSYKRAATDSHRHHHRHRTKHKSRHHRYHSSRGCCCCYCHCKCAKYHNRKRKSHSNESANRRSTSPIVISDDDNNQTTVHSNDRHEIELNTSTSVIAGCASTPETSVQTSVASTSPDLLKNDVPPTECSSQPERKKIFEPPTAQEFYKLLAQFDKKATLVSSQPDCSSVNLPSCSYTLSSVLFCPTKTAATSSSSDEMGL